MRYRGGVANVPIALGVALLVICVDTPGVSAQDRALPVVVEHIAGPDLYIAAGQEQGVLAADTLVVSRDSVGQPEGRLVVVSASRTRAVLTFVDDPFPVTRGDLLYVLLPDGSGRAVDSVSRVAATAAPRTPSTRGRARPQARGRVSLDVNGLQTVTTGLGSDPARRERTFATPTFRFSTTVRHLPAGLRFKTSARASGRFSTGNVVQRTQSVRVYDASLEKLDGPMQFHLGRFYDPYESYSGYWDGLLVRLGSRSIGVGGAVGFEPDRSNEMFAADIPKYTAFLNYRYRGRAARYQTDFSFHQLRPRRDFEDHTFFGWSQDLRVGGFQLHQRLQVDRDPETAQWVVTNFRLRSTTRITNTVSLHAEVSRRRPYVLERIENVISYRRDQAGAGLTVAGPVGVVTLDVTANRAATDAIDLAYGGSFQISEDVLGVGLSGAARYSNVALLRTLYLSPGISRTFGAVQARAYYHYYRTQQPSFTTQSHSADLALTLPITRRLFSSVRARLQRGGNLESNSVYTSLWMTF